MVTKVKKSAKEICKDYCSSTTAHGLGQLGNTENIFLQILWSSVFTAAIVMCVVQTVPLVKRFMSKPTSTKVTLQSEPVSIQGKIRLFHNGLHIIYRGYWLEIFTKSYLKRSLPHLKNMTKNPCPICNSCKKVCV